MNRLMAILFTLASHLLPIQQLPSLPRPIAGQFVGRLDDAVIVAGGCFWTTSDSPTRADAAKRWKTSILMLMPEDRSWHQIAHLPQPLAYGGCISLRNKMVFAGGQNDSMFSARVCALRAVDGRYHWTQWRSLPKPLASFVMAAAGNHIFVVRGQSASDSLANAELWSLPLDSGGNPAGYWIQGPSLPGKSRILAAVAGCNSKLYIVSGAQLERSEDGSLIRHYLQDAWSYTPETGWRALPSLPRALRRRQRSVTPPVFSSWTATTGSLPEAPTNPTCITEASAGLSFALTLSAKYGPPLVNCRWDWSLQAQSCSRTEVLLSQAVKTAPEAAPVTFCN